MDTTDTPNQCADLTAACAVCSTSSAKRCVRCFQVYYCNKEHQQEHWKVHKGSCHPVKISADHSAKKVLVATRDIPKGEIIIKEKPLLAGPRAQSERPDRFPLCLECYRHVRGSYRCTKCTWPLCGPQCQKGKNHSVKECTIFSTNKVRPATDTIDYLNISILRGLFLKEENSARWNQLLELESKADQFGPFEEKFKGAVDFVQIECKQDHDLESIQFVAGANQLNRMSDENDNDAGDVPFGSYVFHKASFASHSCIPNAMWFIQTSGDLHLRASVSIKSGELVTCSTVQMEEGTLTRRAILDIYGINCDCKRCQDPTELGTFMSAIKCQGRICANAGGSEGYYLPRFPMDKISVWKCTNTACGSTKSADWVQDLLSNIKEEYSQIGIKWERQANPNDMLSHFERIRDEEEFIRKYQGKILHKNHSILFKCKKFLTYLIPQLAPYIENNNKRMELEEKQVGWARESLDLADKFWPGYSRYRGQLLYNLQRGLFCLIFSEVENLAKSRRSHAYNTERVIHLREAFQQVLTFRMEIKTILEIEADSKPEKHFALEMEQEGEDFLRIREILQI